jgi:hypothetical protein
MNKKALILAFMLLAIPALTVVPAYAGKGQNNYSFKLLFQGFPSGDPFKVADGNYIYRPQTFTVLGDMYVQIGDGGTVAEFGKDYLEYEAFTNAVIHTKPEIFFTSRVTETISIYSSNTLHDETTLIGTLELKSLGTNRNGNGAAFVGFGTGEFEGVKINGNSGPLEIVGGFMQLTRTGTVMGWPTS